MRVGSDLFCYVGNKRLGKRYVKKVKIESDSELAVKMVQNECEILPECSEVMERINFLRNIFVEVEVCHIDRWDNTKADSLAKSGISRPSLLLLWV